MEIRSEQEQAALRKKYNLWIIVLSVLIPVIVAVLFRVNLRDLGYDVEPLSFLPPIYATINGITAILLVCAVQAVRKGNIVLHERLIKICMACSVAFLGMYVAYHMTSESTPYGGEGWLRPVYFFILITHIILSIVVIPFVLVTFARGITGQIERHRKIARFTYPLWLYVAVTGVIVYLMISPYYAN
jgi:putative membrane protein